MKQKQSNSSALQAKPCQQLLPLGFEATTASQPFFLDGSNEEAWRWLQECPAWGKGQGLVLKGPQGAGLSYMGRLWQQSMGALCYKGEEKEKFLKFLFEASSTPHVWIPKLEFVLRDKEQQRAVLHIYNTVRERQGKIDSHA